MLVFRLKNLRAEEQAISPHGEEARKRHLRRMLRVAVSNHEATDGPASFETREDALPRMRFYAGVWGRDL